MVAAATKKTSILDNIDLADDGEARAFATWCDDQDLAKKTVINYYSDYMQLVYWHRDEYGTPLYLKDLTAHMLVQYKRWMRDVPLAINTINRRIAAVRAACRMAIDLDLRKDDPSAKIKRLPRPQTDPRSLTRNQRNALLRVCESEAKPRDKALVYLMLFCGLRISEACNLDIRDVHLSDRKATVHVRRAKGDQDAIITLSERPREALRAHLDLRGDKPHNWVFCGQGRSDALSEDGGLDVVVKLAKKAGLDHTTPHVMRHSTGRMLVEAGVHISVIQSVMRHRSIETTARYVQAHQADVDQALDAIGGDE